MFQRISDLKLIVIVLLFPFIVSCTKTVTEKYPDGTLKSEVTIKRGAKNGPAKYYFPNGALELSVNYKDDKLDGIYEKFNAQGNKTESTLYAGGLKNGKSEMFYDTGEIQVSANFTNDTIHGDYKEFYQNGQMKVSGQYNKGLYDGNWEYFEANGIKVGYAGFKNGTGKQVALYYGSKRIRTEVSYMNNLKEGEELWFDRDGNPEKKIVYKKGEIVSTEQNTSKP